MAKSDIERLKQCNETSKKASEEQDEEKNKIIEQLMQYIMRKLRSWRTDSTKSSASARRSIGGIQEKQISVKWLDFFSLPWLRSLKNSF
jgi:hypothetical protein